MTKKDLVNKINELGNILEDIETGIRGFKGLIDDAKSLLEDMPIKPDEIDNDEVTEDK